MNITTPTAVLISGILIAIAVYFKDPTPKYHISKIKLAGDALTRTNIETGETCQKGDTWRVREWICGYTESGRTEAGYPERTR